MTIPPPDCSAATTIIGRAVCEGFVKGRDRGLARWAPPPPPAPWWQPGTHPRLWTVAVLALLVVAVTVAARRSPRVADRLQAAAGQVRKHATAANLVRYGGPAGRGLLLALRGAARFVRHGHGSRGKVLRAFGVIGLGLFVIGAPLTSGGLAVRFLARVVGVPPWLLLAALVAAVALVVVAHRADGDDSRGWWTHARLVKAMTDAGVLPRPRADEPPPRLHYRGQPVHDEHGGTAVAVALPAGRTFRDVLAKHEALAGALGVPAHRLAVTQQRDDPAGVVRLHVTSGSVRLQAEPAVASATRTDWRQPVVLGRDGQGRPVTFRTVGTHSALVGGTGSGKTWTGRLVVAHALLDPAVRVFAIVAKDDASDWRPMSPVCEAYVGGVGGDALERVEQVLLAVEQISEARTDAGRDVAPVVLVVEEWYRVRQAAARRDAALAKRLDSLMGELLATSRSRGVHVLALVQRGTVEYLPGDQKANLLQRLVGRTSSEAEVRYVLDEAPTALPSRSGEFLVSTDERTPALVQVDELTDTAWAALCARATALRASTPATAAEAASGQRSPYARPATVSLQKAPRPPAPEPVRDPLVAEVLAVLADGDPRGMSASVILERLPAYVAPPSAARLGRTLARHPEAVQPGHVQGGGRVWRAVSVPSSGTLGTVVLPSSPRFPAVFEDGDDGTREGRHAQDGPAVALPSSPSSAGAR